MSALTAVLVLCLIVGLFVTAFQLGPPEEQDEFLRRRMPVHFVFLGGFSGVIIWSMGARFLGVSVSLFWAALGTGIHIARQLRR